MDIQSISNGFRKSLDSHGYGFQFAIKEYINSIFNWNVAAVEFGVEVKGNDTKIDLVIINRNNPYYLIAECKRANPALACWCFAKATWPHDKYLGSSSFFIKLNRNYGEGCTTERKDILDTKKIYQIALEVRTGEKGDSSGHGRGAIEEAVGQACRGQNGFLELMIAREDILSNQYSFYTMPVVFTTARLFVSQIKVEEADLFSGNIGQDMKLTECDWLWYDYPQSPGLMHSIPQKTKVQNLTEVFYSEFTRRIAIVSASGIESFLKSGLWS